MLGSPTEAKDFFFSLEYKGPKTTHAFLGEAASIDETLNAVISEKSSSIAFQSFYKQFVERGIDFKKFSGRITFKKLSEETQTN